MYHKMRRKSINNQIIRESITEALLILMESKPFARITVMELTEKAGVGRVTFYRNFESKEEVLICLLRAKAIAWFEGVRKSQGQDYIESYFECCQGLIGVVKLLRQHELTYLLMETLQSLIGSAIDEPADSAYKKACLCGCIYGVMTEWIRRDMLDSPEEISRVLAVSKGLLEDILQSIELQPGDWE